MYVRNLIGCALTLALLLPGFVGCQPPANNSAIEDLTKSVKKLSDEMVTRHDLDEAAKGWATKKDVIDFGARVAAVENGLRDNVAATYEHGVFAGQLAKKVNEEIPQQLAKLNDNLEKANVRLAKAESSAALAANLEKRLDKVEQDLQVNVATTHEHGTRLHKIEGDVEENVNATQQQRAELGRIVKKDGLGNSIIAIGELTKQSSEFKEDLRKAVREVTQPPPPPWGTVRIDNRMLSWQYLDVNGIGHWVGPLSYLDVNVPAGWATIRLVQYEPAKNWWVGAPNYFQTVIIDRQPIYNPVVSYP